MKIAIRVDSSVNIGSGHVMRCLTLAEKLKSVSNSITFISADYDGNLISLIEKRGFSVEVLNRKINDVSLGEESKWLGIPWHEDAGACKEILKECDGVDLLIVDHYGIDAKWERKLSSYSAKIFVIDDLADRQHHCDILLDSTFGREITDYRALVEHGKSELLLGSSFTLLRPEFLELRELSLKNRTDNAGIRSILLAMGGMDPPNTSLKVLKALDLERNSNWNVKVILGPGAPHYSELKKIARTFSMNVEVLSTVNNMAELMCDADLAIGAAGTTSWERCCLGLPTIMIQTAANQTFVVESLSKVGAAIYVGDQKELRSEYIISAVREMNNILPKVSGIARKICDGLGVSRIAEYLNMSQLVTLRRVVAGDADMIYQWQCEKGARRYLRTTATPKYDDHIAWVNACIEADAPYFVVEYKGNGAGVLRLTPLDDATYEVSILLSSEFKGKGIGTISMKKIRFLYPRATIFAEVHGQNIASRVLFSKLDYKIEKDQKYYSYPLLNRCESS